MKTPAASHLGAYFRPTVPVPFVHWGAVAIIGIALVSAQEPGDPDRPSIVPGTEIEAPEYEKALPGWEEEAFAEEAGSQLKHVLAWLGGEEESLGAELLAAAATAVPLRPVSERGTSPVFDDGAVRVFRVDAPDTSQRPVEVERAGGALRRLLSAYSDGWAKAKVIESRFEGGDGARTLAWIQFGRRGAEGSVQVNVFWDCRWQRTDGAPRLAAIGWSQYEEIHAAPVPAEAGGGSGEPLFREATRRLIGGDQAFRDDLRHGVDHWLERIEERFGITVGAWHGLAIGDADGDGLDDVYVCSPGGLPNRLFLRRRDGALEDRASEAGVDWTDATQAAVFADLDNDGDQDLVLATLQGALIHSNDGEGKFAVRAALPFPASLPYSIAAADYDVDGDIDLFFACYNERRGMKQRELFERPLPYHDAENGARNVLLRNEGSWKFQHAAKETGLDEKDRRFSYAAAWGDYDDDGDPDLYVANDFGRNTLYRNDRLPDGKTRFVEVAAQAGVEDYGPGMSATWGDYDNDGRLDLYVSNMFSSAGNRIARLDQFLPSSRDVGVRSLFLRHARGNTLFRNLGDGNFKDVSEAAGVTLARWAWGSKFADLNNDGLQDIVVGNGFITQEDSGDL